MLPPTHPPNPGEPGLSAPPEVDARPDDPAPEVPSVLVILVVKDAAGWLKRTLAGLARQSHPRLAILAVDNGSEDGSWEMLASALGKDRVLRFEHNLGFPTAFGRALATSVAHAADHILLMHDDTVLAPDAIERMVEGMRLVDNVGVVGPKVLDWDRPEVLREVGLTADRFGYPASPLEDDEIDQGQYDTPREVLYVSSAALLISRAALERVGSLDDRLDSAHGDLDFCWRVRMAGMRVLVNPRARVLHRAAGDAGLRPGGDPHQGRYLFERAGLLTLLKNYRFVTLLWILPLFALQGVARLAAYLLTRRFGSAAQIAAAWGWNLARLPGTLSRRIRNQSKRRVPDREVTAYMAPAGSRLRRWFLQVSSLAGGSRDASLDLDEEESVVPIRARVTGMLRAHPVAVAWVAGLALCFVAFREILTGPGLEGGALPILPARAGDLLEGFAAGWRETGFGGASGVSPALVPLGLGSLLTLGAPRLLVRLLLAGGPILAGASFYRAAVRRAGEGLPAIAGAACYGLSALSMWTISEGRVGVLALLVAVPWLAARVAEASAAPVARATRWIVGTAMGLALAVAFFPSVWIAFGLLLLAVTLLPERGASLPRAIALSVAAAAVAAVLVYPFALTLLRAGGGAGVDAAGRPDFLAMLRLSPGPAPGSWVPAAFLPIAALVGFAASEHRRRAWRSALLAAVCIPLAWMASAGRLPDVVANPVAFLAVAAFALSMLVALGFRTLLPGVDRVAFGARQLMFGLLAAVVTVGLLFQAARVVAGDWAVGTGRLPPAWPVVTSSDPGVPFRVLWLGRPGGDAFPPPGGTPNGVIAAGDASARYAVTGREGARLLAMGLPAEGPAYERLEQTVGAMLSGVLRHGGAALASMGIRFVAAGPDDLPPAAARQLSRQADLDLVQRLGGLHLWRTAAPAPLARTVPGPDAGVGARAEDLVSPALLPAASPLAPVGDGYAGPAPTEGGVAIVATEHDGRWRLLAGDREVAPFRAFGWAVGFDVPAVAGEVRVSFSGGRVGELIALALLWMAALWVTRRASA